MSPAVLTGIAWVFVVLGIIVAIVVGALILWIMCDEDPEALLAFLAFAAVVGIIIGGIWGSIYLGWWS